MACAWRGIRIEANYRVEAIQEKPDPKGYMNLVLAAIIRMNRIIRLLCHVQTSRLFGKFFKIEQKRALGKKFTSRFD